MPTRITLTLMGVDVVLEPAEGVFTPSPHGMFYARALHVEPGERVIDIGTGSGVLGIAAAKRGAHVLVTDISARAVEAAEHNAQLNGVHIDGRVGTLFAGADGPFDVILANLPNEIVAPAHIARLDPAQAHALAGGARGNEQILALLDAAHRHMHVTSRLYLGVHALTDYHATLRTALEHYALRLLDLAPLPVKPFVTEHLDFYRGLAEAGVIELFRDADGRWCSYGYVYELTCKSME
ncbi:MAG TPA: 50S ribosomal protein L11 methyltransferase [Gemmatimonadaceae bacterium]|nr:50S ribosomal protein L11 methyltransferase [Gemmatimonadaceae bacterium]